MCARPARETMTAPTRGAATGEALREYERVTSDDAEDVDALLERRSYSIPIVRASSGSC
jgi:hypothetical protein